MNEYYLLHSVLIEGLSGLGLNLIHLHVDVQGVKYIAPFTPLRGRVLQLIHLNKPNKNPG